MSQFWQVIATVLVGGLSLGGVVYTSRVAKRSSERQQQIDERLGAQRESREDFTTLYDRLESQLKSALTKIDSLESRLDAEVSARELAEQRADAAERRADAAEKRANRAEQEVARLKKRVASLESELETAKAALRLAVHDETEGV